MWQFFVFVFFDVKMCVYVSWRKEKMASGEKCCGHYRRYMNRNCSVWKIALLLLLMFLEFLVIGTYFNSRRVERELSVAYSRNKQHLSSADRDVWRTFELLRENTVDVSRQKRSIEDVDEITAANIGNWEERSSRGLVRERQPAGDFVHYTNDKRLCGRETSKVLIIIMSQYQQLQERQVVRKTWGSVKLLKSLRGRHQIHWRYIFAIGNFPASFPNGHLVERELSTMNDTLRVDLFEHKFFTNMKYYGILTWALNSCRFQYILTVEIENFVNVPALYDLLHGRNFQAVADVYAGETHTESVSVPVDETKSKKTAKKTLTYVANGAILMSRSLLAKTVPLLRKHHALTYENYQQMIGNVVSLLGLTCQQIDSFRTASRCEYRSSFVLNYEADIMKCFGRLHVKSLKQSPNITEQHHF